MSKARGRITSYTVDRIPHACPISIMRPVQPLRIGHFFLIIADEIMKMLGQCAAVQLAVDNGT
ncbi:Uncharacterised protein [Neisseria gonorrhoeae]|uniref:Uncharacterized protein n=1 Tax=Neisseria gonorrhoeae TaxID=485 RepID=A0A378VXU1_NEIGO|nr:Uncharacterised protein [Neisseria gonorrhoeae]